LNTLLSENRKTAESTRINCVLRLRAIENLLLLSGYEIEIEKDTTTQYIKSLVTPQKIAPSAPAQPDTPSAQTSDGDLADYFAALIKK
jgi:hypothetical protein